MMVHYLLQSTCIFVFAFLSEKYYGSMSDVLTVYITVYILTVYIRKRPLIRDVSFT